MLDNENFEVIECLKTVHEEDFQETMIDPMWAWLDYELDPKGPEGMWVGLDGDRPPIPFKVVCATCGVRFGLHHGKDGLNCDTEIRGEIGKRRFVPKKRNEEFKPTCKNCLRQVKPEQKMGGWICPACRYFHATVTPLSRAGI